MSLSAEQSQAAHRMGQDVCVSAGPGSGKTRVLVERFCWLVEQGVSPLRILAITFTEKAAGEIKNRLVEAFRDRPDTRRQVERAWVSTIHSFCARLLREHALAAGLDPEFAVLDEPASAEMLAESVRETWDALCAGDPHGLRALLESFVEPDNLAFPLVQAYQAARARGVDLQALSQVGLTDPESERGSRRQEAVRVSQRYEAQRRLLADALQQLDRRYRERKRAAAALDFADLIERSLALLENHPSVLTAVRGSFDHILMDEMQDTDPLQWKLMDRIRTPGRFFAVGDINQSIYGFRYAEPEVFRRYRDQIAAQGGQIDELRENYRSRREILRAVERVFRSVDGVEPHVLKPLRSFSPKDEPSVEVLIGHGKNSEAAARIEALWVARRIVELVGSLSLDSREGRRRAGFRDIAVLVRNMNAAPPLEEAFREFRIPYLAGGGKAFFETRQARDLLHLLRAIANTCDEVALAVVLRSPLVGVKDETLVRLKGIGPLGAALWRLHRHDTSAFDAEDLARLRWFCDRLRAARRMRDDVPPDQLLARFVDDSGYEQGADGRARANTAKFLSLVRDIWRRRPLPLRLLVDHLELRRRMEREPEAPPDDSSDVVRLMTVHQAKGLEFPIVFVAAMHKGPNRRQPPLLLGPGGLGAKWRDPADPDKPAKDLAYLEALGDLEARERGEEHRLLYVAMTRAQEHLVLSFAATRRSGSDWPEIVSEALGVERNAVDRAPVVLPLAGKGFSVRLWRTAAEPERAVAPAPMNTPGAEEVVLWDRLKPSGQHDASVSVTSLLLYQNCPRRYYLARYLGWQPPPSRRRSHDEPPSAESDELLLPGAIAFGQQVHALLAGKETDASPEARALAARFHMSGLGQRVARAQVVEREFDFVMEVEGLVVRGQIDLWFEEAGRVAIVDYKTDDISRPDASAHAASYAIQLRLYALALERLNGSRPDEAWVYFLRPDAAVPVSVGPPEVTEALRLVHRFREAQETLNFPLQPGEHCQRCPFFRGLCPAEVPRMAAPQPV
ncbi:MAG: UvrD-helicase domain-containing protein [Bryobacterales bacterium]|nr:UvrD-helicase domain-containing protein [Bryobacteraceae bacterium]MDW8355495.1 UvrD-helicase domain-containing protein [Bryobacterales bacterium]